MEDLFTTQFLWIVLLGGAVIGLVVLAKTPELLVAILLVGPDYIQFLLRLVGYPVSRQTFAAVGGVIFIPVVLLFLMVRMMQTREREPIIGRRNLSFVITAVLLGLWLVIGLTYTDANYYGARKTGEYFIFGLAPMFLAFVFLRDRAAVRRFLVWVIVVTAGSVAFSSIYSLYQQGTILALMPGYAGEEDVMVSGLEVPGHGGLSTPLVVSLGAVLAFSASRTGGRWKVLPIIALPILSLFVALAATRSNVVAFAFVSAVGFFFAYKGKRAMFLIALALLVVVASLLALYGPEDVRDRLFSPWIEEGTVAGGGGYQRVEMLRGIPGHFVTAPILGHGTGDWPVIQAGLDVYAFPHNMFAEILVENGLVGLFFVVALWYLVVRRVWHHLRTAPPGTELFGIAVFGASLLAIEITRALAHFGIAHGSCTLLLTSAITLRATLLEEEAVEQEEPSAEEVGMLLRPVLRPGPLG